MRRLTFLSLALGLGIFTSGAQAGVLFERTLGVNRSDNIFDTNQFDLDLSFALGNLLFPTNLVTLFDDLTISPADVGTTFEATSSSDASFLAAAARITDGLDKVIFLSFTEDQVGGLQEQQGFNETDFFLNGTPPTSPDLAGSIVDRFSLRVDQFTLLPSGDPANPQVDLGLTLTIHGTAIPEPAADWLLLWGLLALGIPLFCRRTSGCP